MEIWKNIDGYEGYQVSNKGRVRSHNKVTYAKRHGKRVWKDRIIKQKVSKDNTARVELWSNGTHKTLLVHRLEAFAFLGVPDDKDMTVNHKDGNRLNNNIENLEWLTRADNIRHAFETGLMSTNRITTIKNIDTGELITFNSMSKASKYLGRCAGYVSNCLKKKRLLTNINNEKYILVKSE